jgi:Ca2+-binding RTX toxin-like protein
MRSAWCVLFVLAGCDVGEIDIDDLIADTQAAGRDPCHDPDIRARVNVRAAAGDPRRFVGTNARDVIFGTAGDDAIFGNGGDDLICGFDGNDLIDGGNGRDTILAGPGEDVVHGRGGSDRIWGGPGPDVLFGDILDDDVYGQDGNDVLIGGHGTDILDGGADNDFLRGDTGNDVFIGDTGHDIASFVTALPPGQPEVRNDGSLNPITGVNVDLDDRACNQGGCADGDGGNEELHGLEQIAGSPFTDRIVATGRTVTASFGETTPTPAGHVYLDVITNPGGDIVELGVVVLGTAGADDLTIVGAGNLVVNVTGAGLTAGTGCTATATGARCDLAAYLAQRPHRPAPFRFVAAWGGEGADRIEIVGDFPRELETHVSGGPGSDHLLGGAQADVLFTGITGTDHLEGRGGDDALLGESHQTLAWRDGDRPEAQTYDGGADILDGGDGNDQLVVDYVCGSHRFIGGTGFDIAGFARSGRHAIHAQLGGPAQYQSTWWGFAANMDLCGSLPGRWTSFRRGVAADLEVLEASDGPDRLWGDDRANVIWSRGGGDRVWALGGDDEIRGADGRDVLDGGSGDNDISYGAQRPQ